MRPSPMSGKDAWSDGRVGRVLFGEQTTGVPLCPRITDQHQSTMPAASTLPIPVALQDEGASCGAETSG